MRRCFSAVLTFRTMRDADGVMCSVFELHVAHEISKRGYRHPLRDYGQTCDVPGNKRHSTMWGSQRSFNCRKDRKAASYYQCEGTTRGGTTGFCDALKNHYSTTFADLYKAKVSTTQNVEKTIKADRKLLQRLLNVVIAGRRVEMVNVLKHEQSPLL